VGERWTLIAGDVREVDLGEGFDAVLCDPPYELGFMGRAWDRSGVAFTPDTWARVLAACKPGAHLMAFGAPRNYHRLACAIEDAGWEIRDSLMWLFGSGFPKSLDVSKAIDKAAGAERQVVGRRTDRAATPKQDIRGGNYMAGVNGAIDCSAITAPATDAARQWSGYGTALKPAYEPIVLARAPLDGTVAHNATAHGCGALAIDAGRVGGRWPANVLLDEEAAAMLDAQSGTLTSGSRASGEFGMMGFGGNGVQPMLAIAGDSGGASRFFYTAKASREDRDHGLKAAPLQMRRSSMNHGNGQSDTRIDGGKTAIGRNPHPTVKPTDLIEYLARLILPPARSTPRRLLVPFAGSGSEMIGALRAGWDEVVGVELVYADLARERLTHADKAHQTALF